MGVVSLVMEGYDSHFLCSVACLQEGRERVYHLACRTKYTTTQFLIIGLEA